MGSFDFEVSNVTGKMEVSHSWHVKKILFNSSSITYLTQPVFAERAFFMSHWRRYSANAYPNIKTKVKWLMEHVMLL